MRNKLNFAVMCANLLIGIMVLIFYNDLPNGQFVITVWLLLSTMVNLFINFTTPKD